MSDPKFVIRQAANCCRNALDGVLNTEPETLERSVALDLYEAYLEELVKVTIKETVTEVAQQMQAGHDAVVDDLRWRCGKKGDCYE